jgi:DNA-binding NarL/FixJ family response regulator
MLPPASIQAGRGTTMTAASRLRVLIIDHDRRVRRGLTDLLTTETDLEVCATAGSPRTALAHISAQRPDVALLDVLLPGPAQGLGLLQKLHALGLPVVVLTADASLRNQAQQSGAAAFLEKDGNLHLIPQALLAAALANQETRRQH